MQKAIECAHCHRTGLRRIERIGFLQTRIYPKFGRFPWECPFCRKITLLKARGFKKRIKPQDVSFLETHPGRPTWFHSRKKSDTPEDVSAT